MAEIDTLDAVVLSALAVGTVAYFTKGKYWAVAKDPFGGAATSNGAGKGGKTRSIIQKMEDMGKNCVIFYGSQTGTAEDYASRLAKEGKSRFGLETMIADLEDYDYDNLDTIPSGHVVMFVLATYGEGEPTDNAVEFYEFLGDDVQFSEDRSPPLDNLNYVAFGLGNNTYEHYNVMVKNVDAKLQKLGAHRIGDVGEGDDGAGTMEEDFLAWKETMWPALTDKMGLVEREAVYEPIFEITENDELTSDSPEVFLGEPNKAHLEGNVQGPFNAHNPYLAPVAESRELFTSGDRNCIHMDVDISGSTLKYQSGDHLAVWPNNPGAEVDRFLEILGLADKRNTVINVKPLEPTAKVPFPTPTTYDAIVRYHLEICAPVSRQFLSTLAAFSPDEEIKAEMTKLGGDKDYFYEKTSDCYYNLTRILENVSGGKKWTNIPFSAIIEGVNKLQPRFYSISSSALMQPKKISITAVVENKVVPARQAENDPFRGVTTNYLYGLKQKQNSDANPAAFNLTYNLSGPRNTFDGIRVPVHVRHSNFKLPSDHSKPVIMIGPGTGVAPFRGFIQERVQQAKNGVNVGPSILFFGCRNKDEDFMYADEWEVCYSQAL
jgi:NADPH-ferrihemoprotein reductase